MLTYNIADYKVQHVVLYKVKQVRKPAHTHLNYLLHTLLHCHQHICHTVQQTPKSQTHEVLAVCSPE